jgi:DNA-binding beta-propeller fold protein YncE
MLKTNTSNRLLPSAILFLFLVQLSSCGGGSSGITPTPPPPPSADFALLVEGPTITTQQGGAPQIQNIQVTPLNGFAGTISLTFSGLPAGVTTVPTAPLLVILPAQPQTTFQMVASLTAPVGNTTVTVTATSGTLTHTATFSLGVKSAAPFAIQTSPASLSMVPASEATVQVSMTAHPGASPQLGVAVTGPPNVSQILIGAAQGFLTTTNPLSFSISATDLAQPLQNYPVTITASDNSGNSSTVILPLTVAIPFSSNTTFTRSTFVRTDKAPTGMVYDPVRKLLFVSVEILNEVQVISTTDGHHVASIPVRFPAGIDEAADGSAVYVVSPYFEGITIIDPNLFQVVGSASVPVSVSGTTQPLTFFQVATLSNGKVVLNLGYIVDASKPPLMIWDPQANTFNWLGASTLGLSVEIISRSADHSKLLGYGGPLGTGILYDVTTDSFIAPTPAISVFAGINSNGSQLASTSSQSNPPVLSFYDSHFSLLGSLPLNAFWLSGPTPKLLYSLDGTHLYVVPDQGIGFNPYSGAVAAVIDTKTFSVVGLVPCFSFGATLPFSGQWITTFAVDETNMLFGAAFGGVGFLDMSSFTFLKEPLPGPFLVQPSLTSLSSPTSAQLNGVGFSTDSTFNLFVGPPPAGPNALKATNLSVQSTNVLNLTIPARGIPGPANATLTRSDGFFEVMPDAVSFGPTILRVDADAGSPAGGDSIKIVGYGLDVPNTQVSIGGRLAAISQTAISGQLFPTESIAVKTPAATSGVVDVTVITPGGSATAAGAFQYVNSVQVYPVTGALDAITYDQSRKRLYVSNQDHNRVEIFDLISNTFSTPISVGKAPTSLAVTPDAQLLAVLNSADGTASVIDLSNMRVVGTLPVLTPADLDKQNCGGVLTEISPALAHRMLVGVNCTSILEGGTAHLINLDNGSLSCVGVAGCGSDGTDVNLNVGAPVLASTPDGAKICFAGNSLGLLDLAANTITINGPQGPWADTAISADGSACALEFGIYDPQMRRLAIMAFEPYADSGTQSFHNVIGEKLNPSGSLLFAPQDSGVDIFDVHTGRLVRHLALPDPIPLDTNTMALDETGTKMFLISNSGITVAQLYQAPLSLATISPRAGPPGTAVILRGSGFENGATVTFGTTQVPATFVDLNTLEATIPSLSPGPVRVTIKNPDGSQYSFDAAYSVN